MASISPSSSNTTTTPSAADLTKQLRLHEVAIAELNNQPSSRAVYQRNGNLFFRTTIQTATATEQSKNSLLVSHLSSFLEETKVLRCQAILIIIVIFLFSKFVLGRTTRVGQSEAKNSEFFFVVIC
ncbi:hypothetical protein E2542_SST01081 [Spatholobus suberectus]|nr:hypothetical protein E2542_SST01081 [Spatholobus suberectus]